MYRSGDIDLVNGFTGPQARELRLPNQSYIFLKKNWIDQSTVDQPTGKYIYTERPSWCATPPSMDSIINLMDLKDKDFS